MGRGWRVEGGGWRVEDGGLRVKGGKWRVEDGSLAITMRPHSDAPLGALSCSRGALPSCRPNLI